MSTRFYWRRAHQVRLADRINTPPHVELRGALRLDVVLSELQRELENSDLTQEQVTRVGEWV
ncbi:hypothetical protein NKH72_24275 [Mesorhizobium sp. M0955]|uniref:hypothetical protein n=1 Tax=Mesorhizobium sp. M0955 TaxID=2957033 RepID=UPI003337A0C5